MITRGYELVLLALIVFVLFGAKRLPDSARALGQSLRIFKAETQALPQAEPRETPSAAASVVPPALVAVPAQAAPAQPLGTRAGHRLPVGEHDAPLR